MKDIPADILRIIDANINRTGEGLRVLEEFSRLSLNDSSITQQLKNLRHKLLNTGMDFQKKLVQARNAAEDVGNAMDVPGEQKTRNESDLIIANSRRLQESLRVLEELSKTPGTGMNSDDFRKARFEIYTIEKELLGRLARRDKIKKLAGLYVIIDTEWLKGRAPRDIAKQAINGGANVIQLRCKSGGIRQFLSIAEEIRPLCAEKDVLFIINDSLEVALAYNADGLHIGQDDIPVITAKKLMPLGMLLGVSARSESEAKLAQKEGADYLGAGAVFSTSTKDSSAIGLNALKNISKAVDLPVVAIGGISKENIASVFKVGAVSAAVISAVMGAEDIEKATRELVEIIKGAEHE